MDSIELGRAKDFAEDTLAQAYLAAIVESSDDAIIAKNLDGIIQSCNAAAERLFGYQPGELIGQSVRVLIPPDRQREEDEEEGRGPQPVEGVAHFFSSRSSATVVCAIALVMLARSFTGLKNFAR